MQTIPVASTNMTFECLSVAPKTRRPKRDDQLTDAEKVLKMQRQMTSLMKGEILEEDKPEQTTDRDGVPQWLVEVLIVAPGQNTIDRVTITSLSEPSVKRGDQVEFAELVARPWAFANDRGGVQSGVTLSAEAVRKLGAPQAPKSNPTPNGAKPEPVPA
jgi:hypothetical protein